MAIIKGVLPLPPTEILPTITTGELKVCP